ncbi:exopolysaccharide biosynthesis polyprenyl glycosylphosphotransferase [Prosthecobacter fusiformis]|uniref:Exopolysaccharide biosynthesis polyprenyl glycosylphosphotransferase n=1 Tax=Prosthecobacter fusiformis TaxID=48464 RepID=A0A4R7SR87_9BACT|nr:sugar transferase [Prosthecobacter fusiformis]TDU81770.1 exopolysaccharide biosynthesis polyprenyl glycosylphosphotransferase [Prosthecobacter fusiformis]
MLGRRQEINLQLTQLLDSALLIFCLWLAHFIRSSVLSQIWPELVEIPPVEKLYWIMAVVGPFTPLVLEARGFYAHFYHKAPARSLRQLAEGLVIMGTIIGALVVFLKWEVPSRSVILMAVMLAGMALLIREAVQRSKLRHQIASGKGRERVLLAGLGSDMESFVEKLPAEQRASLEICSLIDITRQPISDLVAAMHEQSVARVIFAAQHVHFSKIEEAVQACETEGVEAWIAADFFQTAIARPTFDVMGGRLMLVFHSTPQISWALWSKDILDRLGAAVLLLVTLPLWLVAMLGIRLSSTGPIFFRQERSGHYGKPFRMWKFRTMNLDAEARRAELETWNEMTGPVFKISDDPRIFPFGRWLRRMSIDELPQLLNVLRGEMSLVGPRPLPVYEIQKIAKHAQRRRLSVKPGLTCLWQVTGRNGIRNFEEWVALDLQYIDNWSLWLDLKILLRTLPAVLRGVGAS